MPSSGQSSTNGHRYPHKTLCKSLAWAAGTRPLAVELYTDTATGYKLITEATNVNKLLKEKNDREQQISVLEMQHSDCKTFVNSSVPEFSKTHFSGGLILNCIQKIHALHNKVDEARRVKVRDGMILTLRTAQGLVLKLGLDSLNISIGKMAANKLDGDARKDSLNADVNAMKLLSTNVADNLLQDDILHFIRQFCRDAPILPLNDVREFFQAWTAVVGSLIVIAEVADRAMKSTTPKLLHLSESCVPYIREQLGEGDDELKDCLTLCSPLLQSWGTVGGVVSRLPQGGVALKQAFFGGGQGDAPSTNVGKLWRYIDTQIAPCFQDTYNDKKNTFWGVLATPQQAWTKGEKEILSDLVTDNEAKHKDSLQELKILKDSPDHDEEGLKGLCVLAKVGADGVKEYHILELRVQMAGLVRVVSKAAYVFFSGNPKQITAAAADHNSHAWKTLSSNWSLVMDTIAEAHKKYIELKRDHLHSSDEEGLEMLAHFTAQVRIVFIGCVRRWLLLVQGPITGWNDGLPEAWLDTLHSYDIDIIGKRCFTDPHNKFCDDYVAYNAADLKLAYLLDGTRGWLDLGQEEELYKKVHDIHRKLQSYIMTLMAVWTIFGDIADADSYHSKVAYKNEWLRAGKYTGDLGSPQHNIAYPVSERVIRHV